MKSIVNVPKIENEDSDRILIPIDKTPDNHLPIRLLEWYRDSLKFFKDTENSEEDYKKFNEDQKNRKKIIQEAIKILENYNVVEI